MAKNKKTGKKFAVNRKAVAALTLAVALALTVIFVTLGITGRKMDAQGLYNLLPWLPTPSQTSKWREALVPDAGLGETLVSSLSPAVEGEASREDLETAARVLSKRLQELGWTDAAVEIKENGLQVTLPKSAGPDSLNDILSAKGEFTFTDPAGEVFMDGSNITDVAYGYADATGNSIVLSLKFDDFGKEAFARKSTELAGQRITLKRDGEVVVNPRIEDPITQGTVSIPMDSLDVARDNMVLMRSGVLPFALNLQKEGTKGQPLMGAGVQTILLYAMGALFVVIALYFIVRFRLGGLLAAWMMLLQTAFSWFFAALMRAGFTMLTLAAIQLAFFVTVFAFLNLFNGVQRDVQAGRSVRQALRDGYANEGHASLDVFTGLVLLSVAMIILDQGLIRLFGEVFAISLLIGLAITHLLLRVLLNETVWLFGGRTSLYTAGMTNKKEA